jgi:hypothetical protein
VVEGESLAEELRRTPGENYGAWLQKRRSWTEKVSQALTGMGFSTEAAAFRHAGEKDPKILSPGAMPDPRYWYDFYSAQLDGYRTKLQDIVERRLR